MSMKKFYYTFLLGLFLVTLETRVAENISTDTESANINNIYRGDKVLRIATPTDGDFRNLTGTLRYILPDIDVWREPNVRQRSADIYVQRQYLPNVLQYLNESSFTFNTFIDDVQRLIDNEIEEGKSAHRRKRAIVPAVPGSLNVVGKFARHLEILEWQRQLAILYPYLVTLFDIGTSFEGRPMQVIRVGKDVGRWKPAIFIDAAMHAREWIAPSTAIYIIDFLLTRYWDISMPHIRQYVDKIDWYFLVIANPDGYEYTHTHLRLWRKNRRPLPITPTSPYPCTGVDLNRNWGFNWGGENASPGRCDIMYRGPMAMSEPEVQNIANFILDRTDCIKFYISLHSYTQFWFTRWSFADVLPPDHVELLDVAQKAVEAIRKTHGYVYDAGTSPRLLYAFSGGSSDWAKGVAGIKYSYLIELRDRGEYGFLLPPSQIIPTGEEIWAGVEVVARRAFLRYPVSIPIMEEGEEEEKEVEVHSFPEPSDELSAEVSDQDMASSDNITTTTSLPFTVPDLQSETAFHSETPQNHSISSSLEDIENPNTRNGGGTNVNGDANSFTPDLNEDSHHIENSGSSSSSASASQNQNVLLTEVLIYFLMIVKSGLNS